MTPEQLEKLIRSSPKKLVDALGPLSEEERKPLAKTAIALLKKAEKPDGSFDWELSQRAVLAVIAVCPRSMTKRSSVGWMGNQPELVLKVLRDRRPEWLGAFIEDMLGRETNWLTWDVVRELVKSGLCEKPASDRYLELMATSFAWSHHARGRKPLSRRLLDDPDLLDDEVWRLFEVETIAFHPDWAANDLGQHESWSDALLRLCEEGHLDRARLLASSLSALWTTTHSQALSGFKKFHERMKPTLDELQQHERDYRELLSHKTGHVAALGLAQLKQLAIKGKADVPALLEAVRTVLALPQKSHAMNAVRLTKLAIKRHPELAASAADALADAVFHPSADVQAAAVELLAGIGSSIAAEVRGRLEDVRDEVSALVRPNLDALLGDGRTATDAAPCETDSGELWERVQALSTAVRARLGLEAARPADFGDRGPAPLRPDWRELGRLRDESRIEPIETVDELIDAVAHAVEVVDSPDEVDRIVDAVSRLCTDRPDDFDKRTGPLRKRVTEGGGESSRGLIVWATPLSMRDLLLTWLTGRRHTTERQYHEHRGVTRFLDLRMRELAERVAKRVAAPTLAAPTHDGGWIEPRTLVTRVIELDQAGVPLLETDLTQALLRLSPHGRPEALAAAKELGGAAGRALRWVLGDSEQPHCDDPFAWRVAACRSRAPDQDAPAGVVDEIDWPDARRHARFTWRARVREQQNGNQTVKVPIFEVDIEPARPEFFDKLDPNSYGVKSLAKTLGKRVASWLGGDQEPPLDSCPTVLLHHRVADRYWLMSMQPDWLVQWSASVWPLDTDGVCARASQIVQLRLDMDASTLEPLQPHVALLFDPGRELTEMAYVLLVLGLAAKDTDLRGACVDILIAAAQEGRVDPQPLAAAWIKLAEPGWLKPNRLAASLSEVARVSDLHALITAHALQSFLSAQHELPRGSHHLLELLHSCLGSLQGTADKRLLSKLTVRGSSKTAKLARAVRDLEGSPSNARSGAAHQAFWAARIGRAESAQVEASGFSASVLNSD